MVPRRCLEALKQKEILSSFVALRLLSQHSLTVTNGPRENRYRIKKHKIAIFIVLIVSVNIYHLCSCSPPLPPPHEPSRDYTVPIVCCGMGCMLGSDERTEQTPTSSLGLLRPQQEEGMFPSFHILSSLFIPPPLTLQGKHLRFWVFCILLTVPGSCLPI